MVSLQSRQGHLLSHTRQRYHCIVAWPQVGVGPFKAKSSKHVLQTNSFCFWYGYVPNMNCICISTSREPRKVVRKNCGPWQLTPLQPNLLARHLAPAPLGLQPNTVAIRRPYDSWKTTILYFELKQSLSHDVSCKTPATSPKNRVEVGSSSLWTHEKVHDQGHLSSSFVKA